MPILFLSSRDEYTLHRPVVHKFKTHHILIGGPNDTFQGDLVDMGRNSGKYNDNVVFLLTAIDCFSRLAYVEPLKSKSGKDVTNALDNMFTNRDTPTLFGNLKVY